MGQYNDELHYRQTRGESGHSVLADSDRVVNMGRRRWRPMRVPIIVLALGFLLAFVGPLPGLGVVLVMGGTVGFGIAFVKVVLGAEGEMPF